MIYEAFRFGSPVAGRFVLLATVTLFVVTTAIGNSFNGMQTFAALTNHRFIKTYMALTVLMIVIGPLLDAKLMWDIADVVLALVAIPNIIGILILAYKKPEVIKV
jgi:AGCS family alanine or glycine:cation symporter